MKPHYEQDDVALYRGDCLDIMPTLDAGSIDMVLTDPPYGTTACKWDAVIPLEPMWAGIKHCTKKNAAIVMTASQPFTSALVMSNVKMFKYCWVWDKHIPRGFQVAKYRPMNIHEDVCVFGHHKTEYHPQKVLRDKPVTVRNYAKKGNQSSNSIGEYNDPSRSFTYTHRNPDTIIRDMWEANAGKIHPTQKPVALMEYLIKTYTNEGDTVLDFTMGSGTTGVACRNLNRKFIGIEKDAKYFKIAVKRMSPTGLFGATP